MKGLGLTERKERGKKKEKKNKKKRRKGAAHLNGDDLGPRLGLLSKKEVSLEDFGGDGTDYSGAFESEHRFQTDSEAIKWAKSIALAIRFELVISSHKNNGRKKLLRCNRGERYKGTLRDLDSAVRKFMKTKACKCPFQIRVQQFQSCSSWGIRLLPGVTGMHNHSFTVYREGHRQMSGLSHASKLIVQDMTNAQAKPCAIHAAIQNAHPDDCPTRRHVYNERARLRRVSAEGRDVVDQFFHLARKNNYIRWTRADPETNVLTHFFMVHPESAKLVRNYHWFIGMDSTYKTNRYKMPFFEIIGMTLCNKNFVIAYAIIKDETVESYHWVLLKLKHLIGYDVHPTVIVTDRELGLMRPISEIFPETAHLLCTRHINKDVEDRVYKLCGKNKELAQRFKNDKWKTVMEAPTEVEYEKVVLKMRDAWRKFPQVLSYVEQTRLVHREKFVSAWTNNVLHLGNTTTCRVESAHAQLKQWLNSSTGSLDTVWTKVNDEIKLQLTDIKHTLQVSRERAGVMYWGFPFNYLTCHVSHYCLRLLYDEREWMNELSNQVTNRCGCVLRKTHQIPCACELKAAINNKTPISVNDVHDFWKTLVISDTVDHSDFIGADDMSEDQRYFRKLVDEVIASDLAVMRNISVMINEELHPDQASYNEPEVNTTVRGRPKGSKSTKCDPSKWEYSQRGRARGRSSGSSAGRGRRSSTSVHNTATPGDRRNDISQFCHKDQIVEIILPYVEGYLDVIGDGNCGFRVVAHYIFGCQHSWRLVRTNIADHLHANRTLYQLFYIVEGGIDNGIQRIMWDGGPCRADHWMTVIADLFPIATLFNATVFLFGYGDGRGSLYACCTVLPLRAPSSTTRPELEIVIAHLGNLNQHYIRLNLARDFPVPPIVAFWFSQHKPSVDGWDEFYKTRREKWDNLVTSASLS